MNSRFIDLPTRTKLLRLFSLFTLITVILIAVASWLLLSITRETEQFYRDEIKTALILEKIETEFHRARSLQLEMAVTGEDIDEGIGTTQRIIAEVLQLLAQVETKIGHQPRLQELFREYQQTYGAFRETRQEVIFPALQQGRTEEALATLLGIQDQRYKQISALAQEMIRTATENAENSMARARSYAHGAVILFILLGLAAVGLSLYLAARLSDMIVLPLQRIAGYAREVAAGNLLIDVKKEDRLDEFGSLDSDFALMVGNLRELIREILEGVNVLASSGSQILAATTQMASGAAETATSVNETTATVEEVKQTAHLSTEKSQHVAEIAHRAVEASQAGQVAVDDSVEGMRQITGQMEAVTDSIVRLSELSQTIGEIIATVNDLAEQSNLLAVNAAIEAAKAGEHGKGFAVVAQEVRHLAGQSKQATAQVRAILGDIQKATSASVMATEQGTKAVEAGMRQSSRAGDAIRTLSETVEDAATAALQISASSKEQLVGMDQIALAMQNIKTATSQHVSGTRQTEEASTKLHELGSRLKELASRFRV